MFPSLRGSDRPMSDNTVNAALRRLGYSSDEMTGHGFRTMASTLLNELGWNRDAIESQLAHEERDDSRASYNHAQYLAERRKMMQAWADYLETLRSARTPALVDNSTTLQAAHPKRYSLCHVVGFELSSRSPRVRSSTWRDPRR